MAATPEPSPKRPPLARWKVWLFTTILLVAGAALLEGAAHFYLKAFRGYDGSHLIQYEFDPYKNIVPTPGYVDTRGIRHNSVGFRRSAEVPVAKPAGTYRVFLMGASTAYGLGGLWPHLQRDFEVIDNSQTIDAYLERSLQARYPGMRVEVINAAITSTWTHHHLIYLNQKIFRYQPDMIVFLDGYNDFLFVDPAHDQFAAYAYGEQSSRIMGPPTVSSLVFQNFWWLYRKSAFVHLVTKEMRKLGGLFKRTPKADRPAIDVDAYLAGLRTVFPANALAMVRRNTLLVRDAGIIPVVVMQPMLLLERDRPGLEGIERQLFDFNVTSYAPGYEDFVRRAVPWLADTTGKAVTAAGGFFIDGTPIYQTATGQIFTDYAHLTPKGNEMLAGHIEAGITGLIHDDAVAKGLLAPR